ncbi:ergothioneine biosynthesis protein EgtB [Pontibacter ummariensis]|uniref:Ergothioneine biosynthesis protein EgtB n=1 Tax=Pontibacter ummariensis TaxID=1610492 RepID=A0A239C8P6_9BACT|nr:ergothioneine biosynthesis protein EgtB [Pontibacter ummariensis]PRY15383.1 ergothioneine biosynthesis protein EgtB [Pontibacter ummariensis]SNS16615.1 ergothioneine biosynthesis protein EgtB [Pontibacter ummariensis]
MSIQTSIATPAIQQQYQQIRALTEAICRPLEPEDTVVQPIVDVSPPKWHMAHTTWFFETFVLTPYLSGYELYHPRYSFLFNSYYNAVGSRVQRHQRSTLTRPPLRDIYAYRQHVDEHVYQLLQQIRDEELAELLPVLQLGLQHEQQHQELLVTDIKYILSTNPLLPVYQPASQETDARGSTEARFLEVPGGSYTIGYQGDGFCFDNELGVHEVRIEDFQIMNRLVTNREYLEFMEDGGYKDFRHWLDEGLAMVRAQSLEAPLYWLKQENEWYRFSLHGLEKVRPEAPVSHISFYEADAYANWAGKRLLTEFEWEAASQVYPPQSGNFTDSQLLEPLPADPAKDGLQQLYGDLWEWTYSAYHPYPGFTKAPGAIGEYNGKFMINQMVLRGGSCATSGSHIRTTYRNFFHPDKRWQFTGIRLANK